MWIYAKKDAYKLKSEKKIYNPWPYRNNPLILWFLCISGLWVSDLVVCQLQQENVPETARGIVNGVQNSLNSFMDMLKSVLVIFLPCKETFGYLIMISFLFVACGVLTFYYHAFKVSGNSISSCCRGQTLYSKGSKSDSQDECKVEVTWIGWRGLIWNTLLIITL